MRFVIDKFYTLPPSDSECSPCYGAASVISEFVFLSSPCPSDEFLEGASTVGGTSVLCLLSGST